MATGRLIDGDTLDGPNGPVRLSGLDAPELGQPARDERGRRIDAGYWAAAAISKFVLEHMDDGWQLSIHTDGVDRYGRALGTLLLHRDGAEVDVGEWMVRHGYAVAEYGPQYRAAERAARWAGDGLWGFQHIERPKEYRRGRRARPARRRSYAWFWLRLLRSLFRPRRSNVLSWLRLLRRLTR